MNQFDEKFKNHCKFILENGERKSDRTGFGTISYFNPPQLRINVEKEFPLLTLRKIHIKSFIHEILWFIGAYDDKYKKFGNTNIRYLLDHKVSFWTEWPYKDYLKVCDYNGISPLDQKQFENEIKTNDDFALKFGDLGPVYGKQWISFNNSFNQINSVINKLKMDPDSRRILVSAWNPIDMDEALLPCCHILFQFYTNKIPLKNRIQLLIDKVGANYTQFLHDDEAYQDYLDRIFKKYEIPERKLSLMLYMRSNDVYLGSSYNVAEYTLLLHMISQVVNMIPNEFILNTGDAHLYLNSIDATQKIIERTPFNSPKLLLNKDIKNIYDFRESDIQILNYKAHDNIYVEVAV